ncbi:pyridoxal phosphate-dependent aminotransferase, partial [Reinekea blandensis]
MADTSLPNNKRPEPKAFLRDLPSYAVSETVADIKTRFGLSDVVYLASNENPFGCSSTVKSTLNQALENSHRYPDGAGRELKTALASGLGLHMDQVLLGNGSNEILDSVIKGFLGEGDEMLVSAHSFAMYPIMAQWVGANVRQIPMRDWLIDLDGISAAVSDNTRVILLANANNPTGTMVPAEQLERFLCEVPTDVLVLIDEAYIEFAEPAMGSAVSLLSKYPNLVVCRTFSKAYGLAGFRIGYGLGHSDVIEVLEKIQQPFNVNLLAMRA